jgi:hypothetical protein
MHDAQPRGLPGLAEWGLGEPERSGEAPSICFEAGRQTQTQSSVTVFFPRTKEEYLGLQMDVWFCAPQEPLPRGTTRWCGLLRFRHGGFNRARREGISVCPLDFTYHGCPHFSQSNGKIERWHKSLKGECIRPGTPLSLDDARRLLQSYVERYNNVRLNSATGYITPKDMLAGRQQEIHAERDRKLDAARKQRQIRRQHAA